MEAEVTRPQEKTQRRMAKAARGTRIRLAQSPEEKGSWGQAFPGFSVVVLRMVMVFSFRKLKEMNIGFDVGSAGFQIIRIVV